MSDHQGSWRPGAIVWREGATTDLERTTAFYTELLGWSYHDSQHGPGLYRHFVVDGVDVAGAWQITDEGVPSHWLHYVSVPDVDAAAAVATGAGAKLNMGPFDIPHVGRAVYLRDPQGATVALFRGLSGDAEDRARPWPVGWFCWESLLTPDREGSVRFYAQVAGHEAVDFHGAQSSAPATASLAGWPTSGRRRPGRQRPGSPIWRWRSWTRRWRGLWSSARACLSTR